MSDIIMQLKDGRTVYPRPKWYGSIRIFRDGRMRFSPWAFDEANHVTIQHVSPEFSHSVYIGGHQALLLYPWSGRLATACFVYTLTADELRYAVGTLRKVTGGLEGWIVPALEWIQHTPTALRPDVLEILPELLESCCDLPVSPVWQRSRRKAQEEWAKHLETHPEDLPRITAPWMLPEGYNPPLMSATPLPRAGSAARRACR